MPKNKEAVKWVDYFVHPPLKAIFSFIHTYPQLSYVIGGYRHSVLWSRTFFSLSKFFCYDNRL